MWFFTKILKKIPNFKIIHKRNLRAAFSGPGAAPSGMSD
jgi:hypothetical protein